MSSDATGARPAFEVRASRSARAREIVDAARALLEAGGPRGMSLRRVGDAVGMRAPSLYKHFSSRRDLELALVEDGLVEMGAVLHGAISGPAGGRIAVLLSAYRSVGRASPELYRLSTSVSFPRSELPAGLEAWAGEPFFTATGEPALAQALWSFAHGTMILELDRRFLEGSDLDGTWEAGGRAFESVRRGLTGHAAG
ncbi:MAG: TetR/AcrR family transcriptional regulator [Actinomycetota bacterium]|jgi:AcrR family transcriptional regulator|nr:TetR/AcrR family transcriptional regulator [Actinomycetota bacterium]